MVQTHLLRHFRLFATALLILLASLLIGFSFYQSFSTQEAHGATGNALCPLISGGTHCYTPQQIDNAYNIRPLLEKGITGAGQTIVVIGDGASAHLSSDLTFYDHLYRLPDAKRTVLIPFGNLAPSTEDNGVSFDTETAHAIAPGAALDVVLVDLHAGQTFNDQFTILVKAMTYAIDHNLGDVISINTGFGEGCLSPSSIQMEHQALQDARAKHITVLAEAGNDGNVVASCKGSQIIPVKGGESSGC